MAIIKTGDKQKIEKVSVKKNPLPTDTVIVKTGAKVIVERKDK